MTDQPNRATWREYAMILLPVVYESAEYGDTAEQIATAAANIADAICEEERRRFEEKD